MNGKKNSCTGLSVKNIHIIMVFLHIQGIIDIGSGEVQSLAESVEEFPDSCGTNLLMIEPPGAFIDLEGLKRVPELVLHSKLRQTRRENILLLSFISEKNFMGKSILFKNKDDNIHK